MIREVSVEEFQDEIKAQGVERIDFAFVCPMCGHVQSANSLIRAGAGDSMEAVEKYLAFSCVGRWMGAGPPNKKLRPGGPCDWTLGGLFCLTKLFVIDTDGKKHARFMPATPEQAQALAASWPT